MSYPSKAYKVQSLTRMLYHCCIDVVSDDKSPLTRGLLKIHFGIEKASELSQYEFNELITKMIYDLKIALAASSYNELAAQIRSHDRLILISRLFQQESNSITMTNLSFRIPRTVVKDIYNMKKTTLGDVVELAIALFIINFDEITFELFLLSIHNYNDGITTDPID